MISFLLLFFVLFGGLDGSISANAAQGQSAVGLQAVTDSDLGLKSLLSISITPTNPSISTGTTQQFTATGNYKDHHTQDLTTTVAWSSSNQGAARISSSGFATPVGFGQTTIQASLGAIFGQTTLTVGGGFVPTGSLSTAREFHTATRLNSGQVLIAGGTNGLPVASAELYDPSSGAFTPTGSLNTFRYYHTATLLDNGKVLIVGGYAFSCGGFCALASAELYDPSTGTFTPTGSLGTARVLHTATLLNDGKVLIAGGYSCSMFCPLASAELYDPSTGTFSPTGSMSTVRYAHAAVRLDNGKVLIAGGFHFPDPEGVEGLQSAELYDPSTGTFTPTGSLNSLRWLPTATLLNNGRVLIAGGDNGILGIRSTLASAELYDPSAGTFTFTGSMNSSRYRQTATLLNNGSVLIAGGASYSSPYLLASAELYDPSAETFSLTGSLATRQAGATSTLLTDKQVLIAGGEIYGLQIASTELFVPLMQPPAGLVSIALTPAMPSLLVGGVQRFTAIGTFIDGTTQTLVSVIWSSSDSAVATVTNDVSNHGAAFGVAPGSTTIEACTGPICGTTTLTVTP